MTVVVLAQALIVTVSVLSHSSAVPCCVHACYQ